MVVGLCTIESGVAGARKNESYRSFCFVYYTFIALFGEKVAAAAVAEIKRNKVPHYWRC